MITTVEGVPLNVLEEIRGLGGELLFVIAIPPEGERRSYYPHQLRGIGLDEPLRRKTDHQ